MTGVGTDTPGTPATAGAGPSRHGGNRHVRAGDDDRERTAQALQQHMVAGRLSTEEFHERTDAAYAARTLADLDALLADLPKLADPMPVPLDTPGPPRRRGLFGGWRG